MQKNVENLLGLYCKSGHWLIWQTLLQFESQNVIFLLLWIKKVLHAAQQYCTVSFFLVVVKVEVFGSR